MVNSQLAYPLLDSDAILLQHYVISLINLKHVDDELLVQMLLKSNQLFISLCARVRHHHSFKFVI